MPPAPLTLATSGTVSIPAGSKSGIVEAKGIAANGTGNTDTAFVFFARPLDAQFIGKLPSSAPANSSHSIRVLRGGGTSCGATWDPPLMAFVGGTVFPTVRWNTQDTTQFDITLGTYVGLVPDRYVVSCTAEDGTFCRDTLAVQVTYPS